MENLNEERLWRLAKKRAAFKKNLFSFLVINAFLWAIWWFTGGRNGDNRPHPWPVWVMLGWGLGLAFQYFGAYSGSRQDIAIDEFKKLTRKEE